MGRTAIITGISGQDGSYLAKLLLGKNYRVIGIRRPNAPTDLWRFSELGISQDVEMLDLDLQDKEEIISALQKVKPDEIYNLGTNLQYRRVFILQQMLHNIQGLMHCFCLRPLKKQIGRYVFIKPHPRKCLEHPKYRHKMSRPLFSLSALMVPQN